MPNINQNIVDLGHVPVNRGTWEDWTAEQQSELRFYKDNIVQQGDSSYIASPVGYDPVSNPEAYVQGPPYNTTTHSINTGWKLFANGIDEFQTGERVSNVGIDSEPTSSSTNLLTSGGAFNAFKGEGNFDISAYNAVENTPATYETLALALAAVPLDRRVGGMSVKFIQSSDHKYVQYRYMETDATTADTFTNVANWQGVDDEPTAGSDNLVTSDGVYPALGVLFNLIQQTTEKATWYIINVNEGVGTIGPKSQYTTTHYIKCYKGVRYKLTITGRSGLWQENDKVKIGIADHIITQTEQINVILSEVPRQSENTYIINPETDGYMYIAHLVECAIISIYTGSRLSSVEESINTLEENVNTLEGNVQELDEEVLSSTDNVDIASISKEYGYIDNNKQWQLVAGSSTVNKHSLIELTHIYNKIQVQGNSNYNTIIVFLTQSPAYPIVAGTDVVGMIGERVVVNVNETKEISIPTNAKYIYVLRYLYGNDYSPSSITLIRQSVWENISEINEDIANLGERTTELELYHKELPFENVLSSQYLDTTENGEIYAHASYFYAYYFLSEEGKTYKLVNHCTSSTASDAVTISYCDSIPASGVVASIVSRYLPKFGDNITILKGNGKYICCTMYVEKNTLSVYSIPNKEVTFEHITIPSKLYAIKYNANGFNLLNRLYVEGIVNNNNDRNITIDGMPSIFVEEENSAVVGTKTIKASVNLPDGYPYNMSIKVQRVNPALLQNKNLRVMHIGDSLTDNGVSCVSSFILKCLNQDYENINAVFVGTRVDTATIKMGNYEYTCKTSNVGFGGWAISDFLRKIVHVTYTGTTGGSADTMPGKVAWDSLGLATKTRNGSSERPSKVEFSASTETSYGIRNACHGWYDADPSAELWDWLVNKRGITSFTYNGVSYSFSPSYTAADDATQIAAVKYLCADFYAWNTNPFFDYDTVQSSNGEYAFNFAVYLSRYKTLADDGTTRLVVGETAGTRVADVNSHDLCTPSHVCLVMSHNGGIDANDAEMTVDDLILLGNLVREVDNTIKVIIGSNRPYGFCNPQLYTDSGCYKSFTFSQRLFNENEMLKKKIGSTNHLMIDLYAIQNPSGTFKKTAFDILNGNEKIRDVGDLTHAGELIGYIDRAYQFVGAIISTLN